MEIQALAVKFRYHIAGAVLLCLGMFSVVYLAPSFMTILAYFWPLFLSTALFLALVLLFLKTSATSHPLPAHDILEFVAGENHHLPLDSPNDNKSD